MANGPKKESPLILKEWMVRGDKITDQFMGENENLCPPMDTSYISPPMV